MAFGLDGLPRLVFRPTVKRRVTKDIGRALLLARQMVGEALSVKRDLLLPVVSAALRQLPQTTQRVEIVVHPSDLALVQALIHGRVWLLPIGVLIAGFAPLVRPNIGRRTRAYALIALGAAGLVYVALQGFAIGARGPAFESLAGIRALSIGQQPAQVSRGL